MPQNADCATECQLWLERSRTAESVEKREAALRQALNSADRIDVTQSDWPVLCRIELARHLQSSGRKQEALQVCSEAFCLHMDSGGDHDWSVELYELMATLLEDLGEARRSLSFRQVSVTMYREWEGVESINAAHGLMRLAASVRALGLHEHAICAYQETLPVWLKMLPEKEREYAEAMGGLAVALHQAGRRQTAERVYQEALLYSTRVHGQESFETSEMLLRRGELLCERQNFSGAFVLFEEARRIRERLFGVDDWRTEFVRVSESNGHRMAGRFEQAFAAAERAVRGLISAPAYERAKALEALAQSLVARGDLESGAKAFDRACDAASLAPNIDFPVNARWRREYAAVLDRLGRHQAAADQRQRASLMEWALQRIPRAEDLVQARLEKYVDLYGGREEDAG